MTTIQATVNPRLLTKANRFFTGSVTGRIIEILQNARRGGATCVDITNHNGVVAVHDNGRGIDDFSHLLDMGGSGWGDDTEAAEDPAGVGLFCLAPRRVTIRSRGHIAVIEGGGWSGEPPNLKSGRVLQLINGPAMGRIFNSMTSAMLAATERKRRKLGHGKSRRSLPATGWDFWKQPEPKRQSA